MVYPEIRREAPADDLVLLQPLEVVLLVDHGSVVAEEQLELVRYTQMIQLLLCVHVEGIVNFVR